MTKYSNALLLLTLPFLWVAQQLNQSQKKPGKSAFVWEAASVYFLMTDRFYNGVE
jgi:alpha-amylase